MEAAIDTRLAYVFAIHTRWRCTTFSFYIQRMKKNFKLVGKTKESQYKKTYNDIFEVDEYYFAKKAHIHSINKGY